MNKDEEEADHVRTVVLHPIARHHSQAKARAVILQDAPTAAINFQKFLLKKGLPRHVSKLSHPLPCPKTPHQTPNK